MSFAETLALEGIAASIGSIGDAYDNALAESTIGLFKNEAIQFSTLWAFNGETRPFSGGLDCLYSGSRS